MPGDRFHYFRIEAGELIQALETGVLELEKGGASSEVLANLLRFAHTLKGAARVVRLPQIAELAHQLEDLLIALRNAAGAPDKRNINELLALIDRMRDGVGMLSVGEAQPSRARGPRGEAPVTLRIDLRELDKLQDHLFEITNAEAALRRSASSFVACAAALDQLEIACQNPPKAIGAPASDLFSGIENLRNQLNSYRRSLGTDLDKLTSGLARAKQMAEDIRLIPAESGLLELDRVARDAADRLGRSVRFELIGGHVRVDANVLEVVRQCLLHLVGNAVAHGIEPPTERTRLGKPGHGLVRLEVARQGHRVAFRCSDDGRGIQIEAVRAAMIQSTPDCAEELARLSEKQLLSRLIESRISTQSQVSDVAGRGIGLDAVRQLAARLTGDVQIHSQAGHGTQIELAVPVTLAAIPVLEVVDDGVRAGLPLTAVRAIRRIDGKSVFAVPSGEVFDEAGQAIPLLALRTALRRPRAFKQALRIAVIVDAAGKRVALAVDRVGAVKRTVIRAIPRTAWIDPVVNGASVDDDGMIRLIIDAKALGELTQTGGLLQEPIRPQLPVLVIDDSLTTRILEQSILESAGYEVDLATSAEDALERARLRSYGLFIVDVEMPGMNGFEFIETARRDPTISSIPCIIVTSRATEQDIKRGKDLGARAYIVKGNFDQKALLDTVRTVIG